MIFLKQGGELAISKIIAGGETDKFITTVKENIFEILLHLVIEL